MVKEKSENKTRKSEYIMLLSIKISSILGFILIICIGNMNFMSFIDNVNQKVEYINESTNNALHIEDIDISFTNFNTLDKQGLYYYDSLDSDMKIAFSELYVGITSYSNKIKFSNPITEKELNKLIYILQFDCPMLFNFSTNYNYDEKNGKVITFYPEYVMTKNEYAFKIKKVESFVSTFLKKIEDMPDEEKSLYVHDYIAENTTYDIETPDNNNIYGCLINGQANCKGYTYAYIYILRRTGIESAQIIGEVKTKETTIGHSWAMTKIYDEYYYTDVCWDDVDGYEDITHNYVFYNMTYNEMSHNRNLKKQIEYLGNIPKSTSTKYSYYKNKGLYASSYEEAVNIVQKKLPEYLSSNQKSFVIQCKNEDIYNELLDNITYIMEDMINEGTISINYCKYSKIDDGYSLIIHNFS